MTREELNRRRDDIERAVRLGLTFIWLGSRWRISTDAARNWALAHCTDEEAAKLLASERAAAGMTHAALVDLIGWRALGGEIAA